jgi:hypothetical protein
MLDLKSVAKNRDAPRGVRHRAYVAVQCILGVARYAPAGDRTAEEMPARTPHGTQECVCHGAGGQGGPLLQKREGREGGKQWRIFV